MMLMLGIIAGAGLMGVKNLRLPGRLSAWLRPPIITQNVGKLLCLVLIGVTLAMSIPDRQDEPYWHYIDRRDYEAFTWIRDNVSDDYVRAILDPWKATAFTAITQKAIYTRIHAFPTPIDEEAYNFLRRGSTNTTLLRENGISIIYTRVYEWNQNSTFEYSSDNPDLVEVSKNIYLLGEAGTQ